MRVWMPQVLLHNNRFVRTASVRQELQEKFYDSLPDGCIATQCFDATTWKLDTRGSGERKVSSTDPPVLRGHHSL